MIAREPRLRTIVRINIRFLVAALALVSGWLCWQGASAEWWGLGLLAVAATAGGGIAVIATVCEIVALASRERRIAAFTAQGGAARADRMAGERDLQDRGMIR